MGIFSAQLRMSNKQAITATVVSTNVIDLGASGTPYGASVAIPDDKGVSCIPLAVQITEDFNNMTSIKIDVELDDDEAFGSSRVALSETILLADAVAGKKLNNRMVPYGSTERYMRMKYTITGTAPSLGQVNAAIGTDQENPFGVR